MEALWLPIVEMICSSFLRSVRYRTLTTAKFTTVTANAISVDCPMLKAACWQSEQESLWKCYRPQLVSPSEKITVTKLYTDF